MKQTPALLLTLVLASVIALATLSPPGPAGPPMPLTDKQMHALAFAALVLPLGWARPRWAFPVALAALGFGAMIELLQPLVSRSAEWGDLLADLIGIVLGLLPGQLRRRRTA